MSVINGKSDVTLNRQFLRFTPFEGTEYGGRYEGKDSYVQDAYNTLKALGYQVEYVMDGGPISSVTFRAAFNASGGGANADYQDTWELVRNVVQKELLESDHPLVAQISTADMDKLKAAFANPSQYTESNARPTFDNNAGGSPPNYFWDLHQSGVRTIPVKQPILRKTRTTNPFYDVPFYLGNIDTILTTASMISDSGVPFDFANPLQTLANQLIKNHDQASNATRPDSLNLAWGWLKELNSSNKHGKNRIQYVLEYQFGLWDTELYGNPS